MMYQKIHYNCIVIVVYAPSFGNWFIDDAGASIRVAVNICKQLGNDLGRSIGVGVGVGVGDRPSVRLFLHL